MKNQLIQNRLSVVLSMRARDRSFKIAERMKCSRLPFILLISLASNLPTNCNQLISFDKLITSNQLIYTSVVVEEECGTDDAGLDDEIIPISGRASYPDLIHAWANTTYYIEHVVILDYEAVNTLRKLYHHENNFKINEWVRRVFQKVASNLRQLGIHLILIRVIKMKKGTIIYPGKQDKVYIIIRDHVHFYYYNQLVSEGIIPDSFTFLSGHNFEGARYVGKGKIGTICAEDVKEFLPFQHVHITRDFKDITNDERDKESSPEKTPITHAHEIFEAKEYKLSETITHEMGHTLGLRHDFERENGTLINKYNCNCPQISGLYAGHNLYLDKEGLRRRFTCFMDYPWNGGSIPRFKWSNCSMETFIDLERRRNLECLEHLSSTSLGSGSNGSGQTSIGSNGGKGRSEDRIPICGNGIVESNEGCDCTIYDEACVQCCDITKCQLINQPKCKFLITPKPTTKKFVEVETPKITDDKLTDQLIIDSSLKDGPPSGDLNSGVTDDTIPEDTKEKSASKPKNNSTLIIICVVVSIFSLLVIGIGIYCCIKNGKKRNLNAMSNRRIRRKKSIR